VRAKTNAALVAAAAILVAFAIPTGALAAHGRRVRHSGGVTAVFEGRATHGFHFFVVNLAKRGDILLITKSSGHGVEETISYFRRLHGRRPAFDGSALDMRLGRLGRFRGRFVPASTETRPPEKGCAGGPIKTEKGYFVGAFDFRGERGYTRIHSRREHGQVVREPSSACRVAEEHRHGPPRESKAEKERERGETRLVAGDTKANLFLQASRVERPGTPEPVSTEYQVSLTSPEVGGLSVSRSVSVLGFEDPSTFQTPVPADPLADATLEPPAPFSGSADYHLDEPQIASWTGDLAVDLPGYGSVALTGDSIEAGLCAGGTKCPKTLPSTLQPVLESFGGGFGVIVVMKQVSG
jgi:hypothetical protein